VKSPPVAVTTPTKPTAETNTESTDEALLAELEKRKRRAERFGIPLTDTAKALDRAQRFGTVPVATSLSKKESQPKKFVNANTQKNGNTQRQENNKSAVAKVKVTDDPAEAEKAKKRAERFGGGNEVKKVKV
jgi:SAP domain-containing ribonucleoprotein